MSTRGYKLWAAMARPNETLQAPHAAGSVRPKWLMLFGETDRARRRVARSQLVLASTHDVELAQGSQKHQRLHLHVDHIPHADSTRAGDDAVDTDVLIGFVDHRS